MTVTSSVARGPIVRVSMSVGVPCVEVNSVTVNVTPSSSTPGGGSVTLPDLSLRVGSV